MATATPTEQTEQTDMLGTPARPRDLTPITMRTPREMMLITQSLEHRASELESLAKKTRVEGYDREARIMEGDVAAIREHVLPQVRHQQELPLATVDEVRAGIANALRGIVRANILVKGDTEEGIERKKTQATEQILERIAAKVESFFVVAVKSAYSAGYSARETDPHAIAKRALTKLFE